VSAPPETPDAVTLPASIPRSGLAALLLPVWGRDRVYAADQGFLWAVFPGPGQLLHFPLFHPLSPAERYEWWVVAESPGGAPLAAPRRAGSWRDEPGAVKFGFLRAAATVGAPDPCAKAAFLAADAAANLARLARSAAPGRPPQ